MVEGTLWVGDALAEIAKLAHGAVAHRAGGGAYEACLRQGIREGRPAEEGGVERVEDAD